MRRIWNRLSERLCRFVEIENPGIPIRTFSAGFLGEDMRGKYQLISEQENRARLGREGLRDEVLTATPETPSTGLGAESDSHRSPKVCIALLNWNGWQDTVECLTSLQKLNYPEHQT